jgi:type II secretory pathway component GspD/PulD (secretin)
MKKSRTGLLILFLLVGTALNLYSSSGLDQSESKKAIVQVKYISANRVYEILRYYMSRNGRIQVLHERNTLIIEDVPEIVEKVLSIIKEIDMKPLDLQFTVDLILGSLVSESKSGLTGNELRSDPVIRELQKLLKYQSFKRLDSSIIKVQDNKQSSQRMGGDGMSFLLRMEPRLIKEEKANTLQVELRLSQRQGINKEGKEISSTLIDTTLTLKSGERTVVGVSRFDGGDQALILILSGKIIQ